MKIDTSHDFSKIIPSRKKALALVNKLNGQSIKETRNVKGGRTIMLTVGESDTLRFAFYTTPKRLYVTYKDGRGRGSNKEVLTLSETNIYFHAQNII